MKPPILIDLPAQLLGDRVLLRPYRTGDGKALQEAVAESRDHLREWLPFADEHQTVEESEALVRRFESSWTLREDLHFVISSLDDGRFLGACSLCRIDWKVRKFEIGYWLRKSAEGKGYMTETVRLLCQLSFDKLEANRVFIRCGAGNVKSAGVPRRLGFVHEGTHRNEAMKTDGALFDMMVWGMTREMWVSRE